MSVKLLTGKGGREVAVPIIRSMMSNMEDQYGAKKGKQVYYATENKLKKKGKLRSMIAAAKRHGDITYA